MEFLQILKNKKYFIYINIFIFILLTFFFRFIIPAVDQPDFLLRIKKIILGFDDFSSSINKPINFFSYYSSYYDQIISISKKCNLYDSPLNIWFSFNYPDCIDNFNIILIKSSITLCFFLPLLIIFFFKKTLIEKIKVINKKNFEEDLYVISLCLIFPSFIYHANFTSYETLCLMLSLIAFLFRSNFNFLIVLISLIFLIDIGFSFILLSFYLFINLINFLYKNSKLKFFLIHLFILLILVFFIKSLAIDFLSKLPFIGQKVISINEYTAYSGFDTKYPLIIRPLTVFLGFMFLTAYKTKAIFLYIFFIYFFFTILLKVKKGSFYNINNHKEDITNFFCIIFLIFILTIFFPVLSYVKYYMFTLPFVIKFLFIIFNKFKLRNFFLISNFILISNYIIYYIT